jgi:hypothetical protein
MLHARAHRSVSLLLRSVVRLSSHTGHSACGLGVTSAVRRFRYSSFGTGFEVFPFLIVAINHPTTTPPPHVMLHQPRFWSCWVLGRRTEEGVPQHLPDGLQKRGETKEKNYLFPLFTLASLLLFLVSLFPSQQFVFLHDKEIIRVSVVCDKQRPAPTSTSSNCISTDLPNFRRPQHNKNVSKNRRAPTNERKVKAVCAICHVQLLEDTRLCCTCVATNTTPTN